MVKTALQTTQELRRKIELLEMRMEIIAEGERGNRRTANQLKNILDEFTERVSSRIGEALIIPLLQHLIPTNDSLAKLPDPLNIDTLISQAKGNRGRLRCGRRNYRK